MAQILQSTVLTDVIIRADDNNMTQQNLIYAIVDVLGVVGDYPAPTTEEATTTEKLTTTAEATTTKEITTTDPNSYVVSVIDGVSLNVARNSYLSYILGCQDSLNTTNLMFLDTLISAIVSEVPFFSCVLMFLW